MATEQSVEQERKRQHRWLTCTCCGEDFRGRQWWNQDTGYGLGDCCADYCGVSREPRAYSECYGITGVHFLIPKDEPSPIDVFVGCPLFDIDQNLRVDDAGYIYWKGICIDHWDRSILVPNDKNVQDATELRDRCTYLESQNKEVNMTTVIWKWQAPAPADLSVPTRTKYQSHVGLDYKNDHGDLFCFQLLGPDNKAHAIVDFTDGLSTRFQAVSSLNLRAAAIIRLATIYYRKARVEQPV